MPRSKRTAWPRITLAWDTVDASYERHFRDRGIEPDCVSCRKAHCCRQLAISTEEEALIIRATVRQWPQKKRRALEQRLAALPNQARESFRGECPFLANERCQVYAVRPMACRIFHSLNKSSCKRGRKALDAELYSALSDDNRSLREWLETNQAGAKVVAMPIWMKYHLNDSED